MLTYRTGAAGAPGIASAMSIHLRTETNVPEISEKLASYYGNYLNADPGATAALPRRDMTPAMAQLLAIDPNRPLTEKEVQHIFTGLRANGEAIPGQQQQKATDKKARIAFVDLTFSAPKSLSVSLVHAPTGAEMAIHDRSHRDAVDSTLAYIETQIGKARRGSAGKKGYDIGSLTWIQFDHYTARPTLKQPVNENGVIGTVLHTVKVAGDPQRHTHCILPNVVLTDDGHVGAINLQWIKDRVLEWGKIYQVHLATNLRRHGVDVVLDPSTEMARLAAVPKWVEELYSKRTSDGEEAARRYAERQGMDWDRLSPESRISLLKRGTRKARQYKGDDLADYAEWKRQADEAGYSHRSVLRPGEEREPAPERERLAAAYSASLPVLDPKLQKVAKFNGSIARVSAAAGLIETGSLDPAGDIAKITHAYRTEGVMQNGVMTALNWGKLGKEFFQSFTTELHIDQENEAIGLLRAAAADKSGALTSSQIESAVRSVSQKTGLDFTSEHGLKQRDMIERLGTSGRAVVGIGIAGSGKTTLLQPLVEAWESAGKTTYGVTLAWRQTHALADAGVGRSRRRRQVTPDTRGLTDAGFDRTRTYALTAFISSVERGFAKPDKNSVVVIDEIAQVGTRQVLQLARLQAKHGFQIVGLGDDKQCSSIEAGSTIRLFQKALGEDQVPELLNTVRQQAERDRETALMFREGKPAKAKEALERKEEDGTLRIVPGGYRQAVEAAVDLWQQRREANVGVPNYTVAISVPTNHDARMVGSEIRERRKLAGEIGPDKTVVAVADQTGSKYNLAIAEGDRLRLFNRIHNGSSGRFADNGTVVEVVAVQHGGLTLRNPKGVVLGVPWEKMRSAGGEGDIRLTYGDALTIDARQGDTVTEHITVMPAGSQAVNGYKAYTTESRHRIQSHIVTSQGEEIAEVQGRRPLGDQRNLEKDPAIVRAAIIDNMARNLSRHPEKTLATDFIATANRVRKGTVAAMQSAWHRVETREAQGKPGTTINTIIANRQDHFVAKKAFELVSEQQKIVKAVTSIAPQTPRATPTPQPHRTLAPERKVMSETEVISEFADVLHRAGFRIKGPPIMDGTMQRAAVDGDKGKKMSGGYVGHMDGIPSGFWQNFKTAQRANWKSNGQARQLSPEELAERREQEAARRAEKGTEQKARYEKTAGIAQRMWERAAPAVRHAYLTAKGVLPHFTRQDNQGRLVVPLLDQNDKIWNVQTIGEDGAKFFLPGRKQGLYTTIGTPEPGKTIGIAEGFATAATAYELTGIPTVVAFDSGNLMPVAKTIREKDPERQIVFFADNDHHLPRRAPPLPNSGLEKAHEAAREVRGVVLAPSFEPHERRSDWQDKAAHKGRQETRRELREGLAELGVRLPGQSRGAGQER